MKRSWLPSMVLALLALPSTAALVVAAVAALLAWRLLRRRSA